MGLYVETLEDGTQVEVLIELSLVQQEPEPYATRFGWCPPGDATVAQMLQRFPGTKVVRLFFGTRNPQDLLPTWDASPKFNVLPEDVDVFVSFKIWDLDNVEAFVDSIPDRSGRVYLSYHHEPEQGEDSGDPPVLVWKSRWVEFVDRFENHPKRSMLWLAPVFTNYFQLRNEWRDWFPYDAAHGIDAVAWDVYNKDLPPSSTVYNSPTALLAEVRECAEELGLEYLITEISTVRTTSDTTGNGAANWMYSMAEASMLDGNCSGWMFFYFNESNLQTKGRITEDNMLKNIIANLNPA